MYDYLHVGEAALIDFAEPNTIQVPLKVRWKLYLCVNVDLVRINGHEVV